MSTKNISFKVEVPTHRSTVAVAMQKRYGGGCKIMKHRNTPRGGSRNKQAAYKAGEY